MEAAAAGKDVIGAEADRLAVREQGLDGMSRQYRVCLTYGTSTVLEPAGIETGFSNFTTGAAA